MSNNSLVSTVQLRDFNREWIVAIGYSSREQGIVFPM